MKKDWVITDKGFVWFVVRFVAIFCLFYFGSLAVIGLTSPVGYYSPFVDHYLDYVSGLKNGLLYGTKGLLALCGVATNIYSNFRIGFVDGQYVRIAMDCVGIGVYSFWLAYVLANRLPVKRAIAWSLGGLLILFTINTVRITLFLSSINEGWPMPFGLDHHTWFNIVAYIAIFILMWRFEKANKGSALRQGEN